MFDECDRDSGDRIAGRECRIAVINPKRFAVFPITIIFVEGLFPEFVFMLDTGRRT